MHNYSYNDDFGVASIECPESGIQVHTLLQRPGTKRAAKNAYMGARYSRSPESIVAIMQEVADKGIDAVKRLEKIFRDYGHASVGEMCVMTVCIENVPLITPARFFVLNPVHFGQERSTRYQDFGQPAWASTGLTDALPDRFIESYDRLMNRQFRVYQELTRQTQEAFEDHFDARSMTSVERSALTARIFDTSRYLLPIGTLTSFAAVMTARGWSDYIGWMKGSNQAVERIIGELLYQLLVGTPEHLAMGYTPEAGELIRHTEANSTPDETAKDLLTLITPKLRLGRQDMSILMPTTPETTLFHHLHLLQNSTINLKWVRSPGRSLEQRMGEVVFQRHNHYKQIGMIAYSGAIGIQGRVDFGAMRDINRHRALRRFVPFLHNHFNLFPDLMNSSRFELCPYLFLPDFAQLRDAYQSHLNALYDEIYRLACLTMVDTPSATLLEYLRHLLPLAHRTTYRYYGDLDSWQYLIHLRHRPGGHIRYRLLVHEWLTLLAKRSPFWQPMLTHHIEPDPGSRTELLDRR